MNEYEGFANIVRENIELVRAAANTQASQKVVAAILNRFNVVTSQPIQGSIIDLF